MHQPVRFDEAFGARFSVSVDTEEEFDWGGGFCRSSHSLSTIAALRGGQRFFEQSGVVPLYYVDAPVAQRAETIEALGDAIVAGRCDIGAHLHPWVTPPYVEATSTYNSFAGNLPAEVEFAKIQHLRDLIRNALGVSAIAYRAGRYGIGANTTGLLARAGFRFDSSVRPLFNYRAEGGPDFTYAPIHPYFMDRGRRIVELPLTSMYVGWAKRLGAHVCHRMPRVLASAAARTGLVQRISISPEGYPAALATRAIDSAIEMGVRLINISFHSPSLVPGHTPYVRSNSDLDQFYRWFDHIFDHCARAGIRAASLSQIDRAVIAEH